MTLDKMHRDVRRDWARALRGASAAALLAASVLPAQAPRDTMADPRVGLRAGWMDAASAVRNMRHITLVPRPEGFVNPADMSDFGVANTDMAFSGNHVFVGNYNGFQVFDISNPARPVLRGSLVCPGGQGDLSVYGNLLFMSVEETRGRVDCGTQGVRDTVSSDRFRGVRIFDISNLQQPRQVAAVQSCRGSHTHTLLKDPRDAQNIYLYISGTGGVRSPSELPGCSRGGSDDPSSSYFRIEVVRVPLASPQDARIVSQPRVFADSAGGIAGLWRGGEVAPGAQRTAQTNQCHDITTYPELGLAAGACAGNGILLDIRDPVNPRRVDEVFDPNFAYWHSATFNNDGSTLIFTDEWGGGTAARCRSTDRREWGANAIFTRAERLRFASYYKLPAAQSAQENCVAHNGSLIPVPGRDIKVQAWYQGGISVLDFTDPHNPVEIAFFDRGPMDAGALTLGGFWSAYWYNGRIYGSEIGRGLDVLELVPSAHLSQNEIDAARLVRMERFNPQHQEKLTWPAHFAVAKAYLDQLLRHDTLRRAWATPIANEVARAEKLRGTAQRRALTTLAARVEKDAVGASDAGKVMALAATLRELAAVAR